jgi:hypothetical protein
MRIYNLRPFFNPSVYHLDKFLKFLLRLTKENNCRVQTTNTRYIMGFRKWLQRAKRQLQKGAFLRNYSTAKRSFK